MKANFDTGLKVCSCCKQELPLSSFCKNKGSRDDLNNYCRSCMAVKGKRIQSAYREKDHHYPLKKVCSCCGKEKDSSQFSKNKTTKSGLAAYCKDCKKKVDIESYKKNKEPFYRSNKKRTEEKKTAAYLRKKRKENPEFYFLEKIRGWMNKNLKRIDQKKDLKGEVLLGCSYFYFKIYIESQFEEGMSWSNRGSLWSIDHIVPLNYFVTSGMDFRIGLHYMNCRPLWSTQNFSKSDKLPLNYQNIINKISKMIKHGNS